jgi:hypothetical protein
MANWNWKSIAATVALAILGASPLSGSAKTPQKVRLTPIWQFAHDVVKIEMTAGAAYLLSAADHSVVVVDAVTNRSVKRIGAIGMAHGDIYMPVDLSISPSGNFLWVADRGNNRVTRFALDGKYAGSVDVTAPISIAAVNDDSVAVVGTYDEVLFNVRSIRGDRSRAVGELTPTLASSPKQNAYFNRGFVAASGDAVLFAFRSSLEPEIRKYRVSDSALLLKSKISGSRMDEAIDRARPLLEDAARSGRFAYSATVTSIRPQPSTGRIWVTSSVPIVYEADPSGTVIREYEFETADGTPVSLSSLAFGPDGKSGVAIVGRMCFRFQL